LTTQEVVRPIINSLIEKARNVSIAKLAISIENPVDLALISAAKKGELEKVQEILKQNECGYVSVGVAIRKAAINGHLNVVKKLLASEIGETLFCSNEEVIREKFPDAPTDIKEVFVGDCEGAITLILGDENKKDKKNYQDILKRLAQISPKGFGEVVLKTDNSEPFFQEFIQSQNNYRIEDFLNREHRFYQPQVVVILAKNCEEKLKEALIAVARSGSTYLIGQILGEDDLPHFHYIEKTEFIHALIEGGGLSGMKWLFELLALDGLEDHQSSMIDCAFRSAAKNNQTPILERLCKEYRSIIQNQKDSIQYAIPDLARWGNTDLMFKIIKEFDSVSDHIYQKALVMGLAYGHDNLVKRLSVVFAIKPKELIEALEEASKNNPYNPDVISKILDRIAAHPESDSIRQLNFYGYEPFATVINAIVENKDLELLQQLLSLRDVPSQIRCNEYTREYVSTAFNNAVKMGQKELVLCFLDYFKKINLDTTFFQQLVESAVESAVEAGQLEVLKILPKDEIDPIKRKDLVEIAEGQGRSDIVKELLDRGFTLYALAEENNIEKIRELLPALSDSLAVLSSDQDVPTILQQTPPEELAVFKQNLLEKFSPRAIREGLLQASKCRHIDVLKYLYPYFIITSEEPIIRDFYSYGVEDVAPTNNRDLRDFFFSNRFSRFETAWNLETPLLLAIDRGNLEYLNFLLSRHEGSFRLPILEEGIRLAARNCNFPIIACLMRNEQGQIRDIDQRALQDIIDLRRNPDYPTEQLIRTICENLPHITQQFQRFLLEEIRSIFTGLSQEQQEPLISLVNSLEVFVNVDGTVLYVPSWEDVKNNPLIFLKSAVKNSFQRIHFGNGIAIDAGGVTKDFVTNLVDSLKEKKLICADDEHGFGDFVSLPVAKNKEQEEALGLFGKLLTHLYMRNLDRSDKIMIPKILDPRLFAIMLAGEGNELVTLDSSPQLQDIWKNPSTASDDLISCVKAGFEFEGENESFMRAFCEWKASVQKGLSLLKAGIGPQLTAAMGTRNGCRTLQDEFFGREITAQLVMENLKIRRPTEFELSYGKMVRWLKAWINKASIDQLEKFLHCVTGYKSLNMGKIRIEQNNRSGELAQALEIHTCSNSLALPRVKNMDEGSFIQALEASLEQKRYNVG